MWFYILIICNIEINITYNAQGTSLIDHKHSNGTRTIFDSRWETRYNFDNEGRLTEFNNYKDKTARRIVYEEDGSVVESYKSGNEVKPVVYEPNSGYRIETYNDIKEGLQAEYSNPNVYTREQLEIINTFNYGQLDILSYYTDVSKFSPKQLEVLKSFKEENLKILLKKCNAPESLSVERLKELLNLNENELNIRLSGEAAT